MCEGITIKNTINKTLRRVCQRVGPDLASRMRAARYARPGSCVAALSVSTLEVDQHFHQFRPGLKYLRVRGVISLSLDHGCKLLSNIYV